MKLKYSKGYKKTGFFIKAFTTMFFFLGMMAGQLQAGKPVIDGQLSDEQIKAFRSAKTVRVLVNQSFGDATQVSLPFEELTQQLLKDSGLSIVESNTTDSDLNLKIEAKGKALSAFYSGSGLLYTGASLKGIISFKMEGAPIYQNSFYSKIEPPTNIFAGKKRGPSQAPFSLAFDNPNSFVEKFMVIIRDIYGIDALIAALRYDQIKIQGYSYYRFKANAVKAISETKDPRVIKILLDAYNNKKSDLFRSEIVEALGKTKDPRAVDTLIIALKHPGPAVRWEAAKALGKIKSSRSVEHLISILNSEKNFHVRKNTALALKNVTGKNFGENHEQWLRWWKKNKEKFIRDRKQLGEG